MKYIKFYLFTLLSILSTQVSVFAEEQTQEVIEFQKTLQNLAGQELRSLDDAYYIALKNIQKDTNLSEEEREELKTIYLIVQHHLQTYSKELLSKSNSTEARQHAKEFEQRLTKNTPNINYDLQVKNNFSGYESAVLDLILTHACQTALEEKNIEGLLFILGMRCSLLQEATQLLQASSNEKSQEIRKELFQRLEHCKSVYYTIIKELVAEQGENETDNH